MLGLRVTATACWRCWFTICKKARLVNSGSCTPDHAPMQHRQRCIIDMSFTPEAMKHVTSDQDAKTHKHVSWTVGQLE